MNDNSQKHTSANHRPNLNIRIGHDDMLDDLRIRSSEANRVGTVTGHNSLFYGQKPVKIDQKTRERQIINDNLQKDQDLKVNTLRNLFYFLSAETIIIFTIAIAQGFHLWGFNLDEWSFRLLLAVTIGQITYMLTIAVQHLFPHKS
jgi:hypothetical protein